MVKKSEGAACARGVMVSSACKWFWVTEVKQEAGQGRIGLKAGLGASPRSVDHQRFEIGQNHG